MSTEQGASKASAIEKQTSTKKSSEKINVPASNTGKPQAGSAFSRTAVGKQSAAGNPTIPDQPSPVAESTMGEKAHAAILSINVIDIINPPLPLDFCFNPRPITERGVNKLVNEFLTDDFDPFSESAMIPLVLCKEDLDPLCVQKTMILGVGAPLLRLSPQGLTRGILSAAGGQYRRQAVIVARMKLQKRVEILEAKLTIHVNKSHRTVATQDSDTEGTGMSTVSYSNAELRALQTEMEAAKSKIYALGRWGVIIYDSARVLTDPHLSTYLSRNKKFLQTVENDIEKFHHILYTINEFQRINDDFSLRRYIRFSKDTQEKGLAPILQNPETIKVLLTLFRFGPHFHMSTPLSKLWVARNLNESYGGGFIMVYIEESMRIWNGLFSTREVYEFQTPMCNAYLRERNRGSAHEKPEHRSFVVSTSYSVMRDEKDRVLPPSRTMFKALESHYTVNKIEPRNFAVSDDDGWKDTMSKYGAFLTTTFLDEMDNADTSDHRVVTIKNNMRNKLLWIQLDHSKYHYLPLLPLVTPSILECIGQLFERIPKALLEFVSWVCPSALYFSWGNKDQSSPHDMAQFAIQTLRGNFDETFASDHFATEAAKIFGTFPFRYISLFHQLAQDLEMYCIPERPLYASEQAQKKLKGTFPDAVELAPQVEAWMKTVRDKKETNDYHPKYWVLNQRTIKDWRSPGIRNTKRDYTRYALVALIEADVVSQYRETLLKKSKAAEYLRDTFERMITPLCNARKIRWHKMQTVQTEKWLYPDTIEINTKRMLLSRPKVDLGKLEKSRNLVVSRAKALKLAAMALDALQKHEFAKAKPGSNFVSDKIRSTLDQLEKEIIKNMFHLEAMKSAPNSDDIDPNDPAYEVDTDEKIVLPYIRILSWTEAQQAGERSEKEIHESASEPESGNGMELSTSKSSAKVGLSKLPAESTTRTHVPVTAEALEESVAFVRDTKNTSDSPVAAHGKKRVASFFVEVPPPPKKACYRKAET